MAIKFIAPKSKSNTHNPAHVSLQTKKSVNNKNKVINYMQASIGMDWVEHIYGSRPKTGSKIHLSIAVDEEKEALYIFRLDNGYSCHVSKNHARLTVLHRDGVPRFNDFEERKQLPTKIELIDDIIAIRIDLSNTGVTFCNVADKIGDFI